MARPRLRIGEQGETQLVQVSAKEWVARVRVRDPDGHVRQVKGAGITKAAARRALEQRLATRTVPTGNGVSADMSVAELATFWLEHRSRHGKARTQGPIAPQTLAGYDDAIRSVVIPSIGSVPLAEVRVAMLDDVLARVESGADGKTGRDGTPGRSTALARSVLSQMFNLAVRHEAIASNPMRLVESSSRSLRGGKEVHHLDVASARRLRTLVRRDVVRVPGRRMPNSDLQEWVDVVLGTGLRDGEALALRWIDLDLDPGADPDTRRGPGPGPGPGCEAISTASAAPLTRGPSAHADDHTRTDPPTMRVAGTIVEPRGDYVRHVHRQPMTKSRAERTLILPDHVVEVLRRRRERSQWTGSEDPVFATGTGGWISPANMRARLRRATAPDPVLRTTSPHTLRRTVGTLIAHQVSLDAARDQLGHSDPSVTFQHYVAKRVLGPDLRDLLSVFFEPE